MYLDGNDLYVDPPKHEQNSIIAYENTLPQVRLGGVGAAWKSYTSYLNCFGESSN